MAKTDKVNILIVDDKEANIFALEQILARADRNIISATTGSEALKIVLKSDISLIVLDVQMPGMDGFEVAQILKSNKRTRDIPIIFASAEKKEHQFMVKGFEEGAIDYLHKPLNKEITEAKVAVLLKLHLQQKELMAKNNALEKYALLINNSADIICIINPKTLKFEEVNDAVAPLLGYSAPEMKGTSLLLYIANEHHAEIEGYSRETGEKISFETRVYDKKRRMKWLHWKVINKKGLWFANARDVTEAREVEEIKHYLATVVKQSNDAIYLHNPSGEIISWNEGAEKIYGFSEAEALNMKVWNIVPQFLMNEAQQVVNSILGGKQIQSLETKRITKYGDIIDVVFSASIVMDHGVLKSVAITERDITQQKKSELAIKQLNEELQRNIGQLEVTNKELESFSYSVSHDLRSPLRAINGYANIILEDFGENLDDGLKRHLAIIQSNASRMGMLINDLLEFSRLGRKPIVKSTIDTNKMIANVVQELCGNGYEKTRVKIGELLPMEGDHTLLYQVLVNLCSNAFKYSSKKADPAVEISSYETGSGNVYCVKDNGAGFDMDYADKLFGVFQRLHTAEEFEGTGVGLAIVQRIITKHGGKVWAEGEPDKGATFCFSLPK